MSPISMIAPSIAIVDDDQAMREALDDLIHSCGYTSQLFESAEAFLSCPDRRAFDCMLVDVKMPGISGIELQAGLNGEPSRPPIIFVTSYPDERRALRPWTAAHLHSLHSLAFLGKPVEFDSLIAYLDIALRRADPAI